MIDYDGLLPYGQRYESLSVEPLCVTVHLVPGSRIAGYDALNLDNLLARAVVEEATQGRGLPNTDQAYRLPVPLECLWRSENGFPLWAATPFVPMGLSAHDVAYWHKRAQSGAWTGAKRGTFAIRATQGRWMERRVPLPTTVAEQFVASCVGNAEEIARLLQLIGGHVGKRRSSGFGEVRGWEIGQGDFGLVHEGRLSRSFPAMAIALLPAGTMPEGQPAPVGWTPPQWKPSLFMLGWWPGTPVVRIGQMQ